MNDMSLKAKIKKIASEKNVSAQSVLQNYLLSRFLFRLSESQYKEKFVVKGGMLISSIVGINQRATMDLDTTLRNLPLTRQTIETAFNDICSIITDDGLEFKLNLIAPIRDNDDYGGYRVTFYAQYGKINVPMSMDISTGDIITPGAEKRVFRDIIDSEQSFELWAYPIETVISEKLETILSRSTDNTRPRDFYDVYMLSVLDYDIDIMKEAYIKTAIHRGSFEKIKSFDSILSEIESNPEMNNRWVNYTKQMPYAEGINFSDAIERARTILHRIHR